MPSDPEEKEICSMMEFGKSSEHSMHSVSETSIDSNSLLNSEVAGRELTPTKRRKSPANSFGSDNTSTSVQPPVSPTSSLTDTTFEPSIDMMVNDFDDEATLNEEEALADLEAHNTEDEIAALREEGEMPIEQLLAKYSGITDADIPMTSPPTSSARRSASSRRRRELLRQQKEASTIKLQQSEGSFHMDTDENDFTASIGQHQEVDEDLLDDLTSISVQLSEARSENEVIAILPPEVTKKQHRSHLFDLYPDESFREHNTTEPLNRIETFTPLHTLFDEAEVEDDEETDTDSDDSRKIIMVGPDYQAEIPEGLSQYGDILPYENEDQLIWEPTQVSEREVENYLTKVQGTKSIAIAEEGVINATSEFSERTQPNDNTGLTGLTSNEIESIVKDNEQALHLLVQCGYDFKEALRRKRISVLPLSDAMSSWSEEECQKFEEGIQKFGKDFYQIRQNQVRTRTMRELVQFYYLWKKSERRDQCFALNDTVDHMDVFINEGGERAGNENGNGNGSSSSHSSSGSSNGHGNGIEHAQESFSLRRSTSRNYSIMTGNSGCLTGGSRKRRSSFALEFEDNEDDQNVKDV